jgi:hypothetical protein
VGTKWPFARRSQVAFHPRAVVANSNAVGLAENARAQSAIHKRLEDMGSTLAQMHALLKQMQAKSSAGGHSDPMVQANLEMWGLMLSHLDKQFEELRLTSRAKEDVDARRSALYKQAEANAAAARRAQESAGSTTPARSAGQTSNSGSAGQSATEPTAAQSTASPTPGSSPN